MSHTANRLEDHWSEMLPLLRQAWPQLSDADWEYIDQRFDRLVEIVRERCGGRGEIIQEAALRQKVLDLLSQVEA